MPDWVCDFPWLFDRTPENWTAAGTWGLVLGAVLAAVFGIRQLGALHQQLFKMEGQLMEAKAFRRDSLRPILRVELTAELRESTYILGTVAIRNVGPGAATAITVRYWHRSDMHHAELPMLLETPTSTTVPSGHQFQIPALGAGHSESKAVFMSVDGDADTHWVVADALYSSAQHDDEELYRADPNWTFVARE